MQKENEKNRIKWIDFIKGVGIFLVLVGHVSTNTYINSFIYMFHMPLFFIVSGYLSNINKKEYIKNKFIKLIIPYFIFAIVTYIYWFLIERHLRKQNIDILFPLKNIFLMKATADGYVFNIALWFLPCLFSVEMIFFCMNKMFKKFSTIIMMCISLAFSFFGIYKKSFINLNVRWLFAIDSAIMVMFFYCFGYLLKRYNILNKIRLSRISKVVIVVFGIIILIILSIFSNNGINVMNLYIRNYVIFIISPIVSFAIIYLLSLLLNESSFIMLGRHTLFIMCTHEPIKRIIIKFVSKLTKISDTGLRENTWSVLFLTVFLIICICLIEYIVKLIIVNTKKC